jgi:cytochrome b subunit of formate dehydrogenase
MSKSTLKPKPQAKTTRARSAKKPGAASRKPRFYQRFHWSQRIAHGFLLSSFTLLGITGLSQKYSLSSIGQFLIRLFGGIETTRLIHHIAAAILMLLAIYHILDLGNKIFVHRVRLTMLPGVKDVRDAIQAFGYNLGLAKKRPQMGRYTFEEKLEYWALIWGIAIMGITGFMMWNPITTTKFLPGEVIPAAKSAHGGEALLAVAAIIIWHMYGVHIKRFNKSMFTGKMSEEDMRHEHPIELADIKAGIIAPPIPPKSLHRRQIIYWPIASILALVMLFGVYKFTSGEKTAITTIPPAEASIQVFSPRTPTPLPTMTNEASEASIILTWNDSVAAILQAKCGICHGPASVTGFSMGTYANFIQGGTDGPVIVPGDPSMSLLVQVQSEGGHPGQLSPDELSTITNWITAGAPEK